MLYVCRNLVEIVTDSNLGYSMIVWQCDSPRNYLCVSLTFVLGKTVKQIFLERHIEDREVIWDNHEWQALPDTLSGLYNSITASVKSKGKSRWCHLSGLQYGLWRGPPQHPSPLNWKDINGINSEIKCTFSKSTNDTKLCCVVNMPKGWDSIKRDLDSLKQWALESLMKFKKSKCKVLYLICGVCDTTISKSRRTKG